MPLEQNRQQVLQITFTSRQVHPMMSSLVWVSRPIFSDRGLVSSGLGLGVITRGLGNTAVGSR